MKQNVITSLVIIAAINSPASALQITKGKLISHKEWATNGAKASFEIGTKSLQNMKLTKDTNVIPSTTMSEVHSSTTITGTPISIKNDALVTISNTTNQTRIYRITSNICAESDVSGNVECVNYLNEISLEPGGYYGDGTAPTITISYKTPGTYSLSGVTYYQENSYPDHSLSHSGYSYSTANITVS